MPSTRPAAGPWQPGVRRSADSALWADPQLGVLARELYRRCGLVFEGGQSHLFRKRVRRRAGECGYGDVADYAAALVSARHEEEFERLIEVLTVNETYFFREEEHYRLLLDHFWPVWVKAGRGPLRVWSAACSIGCEPYTLAMLLQERGSAWAPPGRVEILGTDVNGRVVEEAQRAEYGEFSLRNTPQYYREKYFDAEGGRYRLDTRTRDMVRFRKRNLLREERGGTGEKYHVIFCRNVLIYFDLNAKRRVIGALTRSLVPGGVLLVGRSESLFNVPEAPPVAPPVASHRGVLVHQAPS